MSSPQLLCVRSPPPAAQLMQRTPCPHEPPPTEGPQVGTPNHIIMSLERCSKNFLHGFESFDAERVRAAAASQLVMPAPPTCPSRTPKDLLPN
jgi:hypothetical protein